QLARATDSPPRKTKPPPGLPPRRVSVRPQAASYARARQPRAAAPRLAVRHPPQPFLGVLDSQLRQSLPHRRYAWAPNKQVHRRGAAALDDERTSVAPRPVQPLVRP